MAKRRRPKWLTPSNGLYAFAALWFVLAAWLLAVNVHATVRYDAVTATLVQNEAGTCSEYQGEGTSRREVTWKCFMPRARYVVRGEEHSTILMFRTSEVPYADGMTFALWVNPADPLAPIEAGVRGWAKPIAAFAAGLIVALFAYLARER